MKKAIMIIKLTSICLLLTLIGCIQQENSNKFMKTTGDTDKIELIDYSISVISASGQKLADNFTYIDGMFAYKINGTIRSIYNNYIQKLQIRAIFYDSDENILNSYETAIYALEYQYIKEFNIYFLDKDNFKNIDNFTIEFVIVS
jgi:hypothetical protein